MTRPRLRRVVAVATLFAATALVHADEPATPDGRADDVLAAIRANDDARLRSLAAAADPDPWVVSDRLCSRGAGDAAADFARAVPPSPDVEALPRWVEQRKTSPPPASVADALRSAAAATDEPTLVAAIGSADAVASPFDRARLQRTLAARLLALRERADAVEAFVAAADAAERAGWLRMAAEALAGAAFHSAGVLEYERARALWTRQLAVERRRGRGDRAAGALGNLAGVASLIGDYPTAGAEYEAALHELAALGERGRRDTILVLRNLAITRTSAGRYASALDACRRALALVAGQGEEALRAYLLLVEGDVEAALGDVDRAERAHRRALAAAEESGDSGVATLCRGTLASDARDRGDLDGALAGYEAVLEPLTAPEQEPLVLRLLVNLTEVLNLRREFDRSREHGERAVALAEKLRDETLRAAALQNLAHACRGAGDPAAARSAADAAIAIAARIDSSQVAASTWIEVAENALASGDAPAAVDASRRAIAAVVRMTSGLAEGQGAQARAKHGRTFRLANAAAIGLGDAATLFEFAESGRAVEFLASLEQGDSIRAAAVAPALRETESAARVAESIASVRHQAALGSGDLAAIKARRAELDAARARHEDAISAIRRDVRSGAAIFPQPVSDAEARAALGDGDAMVIYALSDEKGAALVLTREATRLVPLGDAKALAAACAAWSPSADAGRADAAISALRRTLVDPLGLPDTTRRVLVSPDGDVYRAPLAALFHGREVVHVPSASSYVRIAADGKLRGAKVLAVGAPDYAGTRFAPLPGSGAEAKDVGDVVVSGREATEAGVRAAIAKEARWRSVHFAVHGVVDERRPMLCGLALTAADSDDGLMTALEVLQQPVPADLVVLSACDSGGGRVFAGEGLVGMPRAFLFAGSPRVIASSWKVDDAATRALMTKFYELWRAGKRASAALAGAQDAVRADERWRHPRYWAAWTIWGIGD